MVTTESICENFQMSSFSLSCVFTYCKIILSTDQCPRNCSNHGECIRVSNQESRCQCDSPFTGSDCASGTEMICNDGIDNDAGPIRFISLHIRSM